ncbi:hypothetical protein ABMA28_010239 [Loxostege sticticalis]|uniref:Uncharacterized protein n=1 Tax=Loxostege sticticalis TaxID=481309 RepID=A0ABD0SA61_LOXSC
MVPMILEGNNLGQRHRHYNSLLKETLASNEGVTPDKISNDDNDIENFLKIDIASHNRDVNYILEVLKCKDLLYVTRAIKKSRWLITDSKYSHIVNPKYFHKELFPYMMSKAKSKLVLYVRLHLRDEKRVQVFYNYYKQFDNRHATKWLQYCPLQFALHEVHDNAVHVSKSTLKRLCRKSFEFLNKYATSSQVPEWDKQAHLKEVQFLVRHNTEEFLNFTDSCRDLYSSFLKTKYLKYIMKTCPLRILNNFHHYFYAVVIALFTHTVEFKFSRFIKYIDKDLMKQFLLDSSKNQELSERFKYHDDVLKQFLLKIEYSDRIEVIKAFYNLATDINCQGPDGLNLMFSAIENNVSFNNPRVFLWYQAMPFNVAFLEITKLIQKESNADVRLSMLETLLICAGPNFQDQSILLKYYHDRHINEPHKFKESFLNKFVSSVTYYKFDSEMWTILDNLFCSMEVYMNSSLSVTKCVEAIVVYKTIHDQTIPEIVEKKFNFETLIFYKNKVGATESEKLFKYLYNSQMKKLEVIGSNEKEYCAIVESLKNILNLVKDWGRNLIDYPVLISKMKECTKIKKQHNWDIDLSTLYNIHKPWRRHFFEDSLMLYPSELVLLNALKHDQNLLHLYQTEVDSIRYHDMKLLQPVLTKLKIYWSDTLAKEWINNYLVRLNEIGKQKNAIQSLAVLQSQKDFLNIAKQYIPQESKINWQEADEVEYYCRKYFAKNIHKVRPILDTDVVLWFANGDYLKFAVTALSATLANISPIDREAYASKLTNVPVSLQKHGIRMVLAKLGIEKIIPAFEKIWKSTTNPTIHTTLFLITHSLLRNQSSNTRILKLWTLLKIFIDNLTGSENPGIYKKMCNVGEVPWNIQSEYFMKGYLYFQTLPGNLAEKYSDAIISKASECTVEILDKMFIEDKILGSVEDFPSKSASVVTFFARYLLYLTDKKSIISLYERRVKPLYKTDYYSCINEKELIANLFSKLFDHITRNRTVPITLFKTLFNDFTKILSFPEDYVSLRMWELTCDLLEIFERHISEGEIISTAVLTDFGKACLKVLQRDIKLLAFPIPDFECVMRNLYFKLDFSQIHMLQIYKNMLGDQSTVESYFIVLNLLQDIEIKIYHTWYTQETEMRKELLDKLSSHPCKEVQVICRHYFHQHLPEVKLKSGEILPPDDSWK